MNITSDVLARKRSTLEPSLTERVKSLELELLGLTLRVRSLEQRLQSLPTIKDWAITPASPKDLQ